MKKLVITLTVLTVAFVVATPALAVSLGVSPSHVEIEVPGDGIGLVNVQVHYFSGDVQVSLVDIPLQVEPEILHVNDDPQEFQITIYGDESLGSQVYDGYIRFLGLSGETVAVAVKIKATVTNIVAGQPLPEPEPAAPEVAVTPETTDSAEGMIAANSTPPPAGEEESGWLGSIEGISTNLVIIIAAAVVFLGLVILAISMVFRRRRRYY